MISVTVHIQASLENSGCLWFAMKLNEPAVSNTVEHTDYRDISDVLRRADQLLEEHGYRRSETWGVSEAGVFRAVVEECENDPSLLSEISGTRLKDIEGDDHLARLLSAHDSHDFSLLENWRYQPGYDQDSDKAVLVHNGKRWLGAYLLESEDHWVGSMPTRFSTNSMMTTKDFTREVERLNGYGA